VLSVGSPKLVIELQQSVFESLRHNLQKLSYQKLLDFQQQNNINGIHIFYRDLISNLPTGCIQNNAFSGPDNLADRATGVSNAAQIIADKNVQSGQTLHVTQFSFSGAAAVLNMTKLSDKQALVGGAAVLFNSVIVDSADSL